MRIAGLTAIEVAIAVVVVAGVIIAALAVYNRQVRNRFYMDALEAPSKVFSMSVSPTTIHAAAGEKISLRLAFTNTTRHDLSFFLDDGEAFYFAAEPEKDAGIKVAIDEFWNLAPEEREKDDAVVYEAIMDHNDEVIWHGKSLDVKAGEMFEIGATFTLSNLGEYEGPLQLRRAGHAILSSNPIKITVVESEHDSGAQ